MKKSAIWPKVPPELSQEQKLAREKFMMLWHQVLPKKYSVIEKFNHASVANQSFKPGSKTLEIGAGLGAHSKFEDLNNQDYYSLEYREEFCIELRKQFAADRVECGDITLKQKWEDKTFDRIIAIHVLEHICDLPAALVEISRMLKDDGIFDVVLPCEGKMSYTIARKISAERLFKKNFKMSYLPIVRNGHVSDYDEIIELMQEYFNVESSNYFPLILPIAAMNLVVRLRFTKKNLQSLS